MLTAAMLMEYLIENGGDLLGKMDATVDDETDVGTVDVFANGYYSFSFQVVGAEVAIIKSDNCECRRCVIDLTDTDSLATLLHRCITPIGDWP